MSYYYMYASSYCYIRVSYYYIYVSYYYMYASAYSYVRVSSIGAGSGDAGVDLLLCTVYVCPHTQSYCSSVAALLQLLHAHVAVYYTTVYVCPHTTMYDILLCIYMSSY